MINKAVIKTFFGLFKSELHYLKEFESINHFNLKLDNYIHYNHKRKNKIKRDEPDTIPDSYSNSHLILLSNFPVQLRAVFLLHIHIGFIYCIVCCSATNVQFPLQTLYTSHKFIDFRQQCINHFGCPIPHDTYSSQSHYSFLILYNT
ncbi:IS3 family transposase [Bacillus sp. FSL K6-0268]|uniref:IS3 family transposase n=1 Tax=Bacillus sp. FSL K6-0268 TaxID=2921449 RepID=UPI004046D155